MVVPQADARSVTVARRQHANYAMARPLGRGQPLRTPLVSPRVVYESLVVSVGGGCRVEREP